MSSHDLIRGLPGEALIRQGLADLAAGRVSVPVCLVAIARPRLARAGLLPPTGIPAIAEPELMLCRLLRQEGGDAYSRYNSLLRELVSFEQALDARLMPVMPVVSRYCTAGSCCRGGQPQDAAEGERTAHTFGRQVQSHAGSLCAHDKDNEQETQIRSPTTPGGFPKGSTAVLPTARVLSGRDRSGSQ